MYKKITPIIIMLFSIALSAASQMSVENLQTEKQIPVSEQSLSKIQTAESSVKHRVVIQLSSNDSLVWKGVMNNIMNLKTAWGDNVQIEVVAHGPGGEMLITAKTTEQKKIAGFKKMGVEFVVCENTLKTKNIPKEAIIPEAGFVPSALAK